MSRSLVQPVGQKRLTNVAVVRLKKHGNRFEIACFKNKVLSWRSRVEKDIDEVVQTHTVYTNVSKGVLAKSKDLIEAFGTADEGKICLEILEKGELQVAGKEREQQLSSQFRDIAMIVMEKTLNPETERPYTISMIERLMRDVHFAVDPHGSSKKQALELIKQLQNHFPITRARMKLKLLVAAVHEEKLSERLKAWEARIEMQTSDNGNFTVICQVEPGHFRSCDELIRDCGGRLEVMAMAVHNDDDGDGDGGDDDVEEEKLASQLKKQLSTSSSSSVAVEVAVAVGAAEGKKCTTCNTVVEDAKEYREHCKSEWHKHNMSRKVRNLPPISAEECLLDLTMMNENDMNEYC